MFEFLTNSITLQTLTSTKLFPLSAFSLKTVFTNYCKWTGCFLLSHFCCKFSKFIFVIFCYGAMRIPHQYQYRYALSNYRVGRKQDHKVVAIISSNLNRCSKKDFTGTFFNKFAVR